MYSSSRSSPKVIRLVKKPISPCIYEHTQQQYDSPSHKIRTAPSKFACYDFAYSQSFQVTVDWFRILIGTELRGNEQQQLRYYIARICGTKSGRSLVGEAVASVNPCPLMNNTALPVVGCSSAVPLNGTPILAYICVDSFCFYQVPVYGKFAFTCHRWYATDVCGASPFFVCFCSCVGVENNRVHFFCAVRTDAGGILLPCDCKKRSLSHRLVWLLCVPRS